MKTKPKEVMLLLPSVRLFTHESEDAQWAAVLNEFMYGKVRVKYECLGTLGGKYVSIFYLQRNNEFSEMRGEFMDLILQEESQQ